MARKIASSRYEPKSLLGDQAEPNHQAIAYQVVLPRLRLVRLWLDFGRLRVTSVDFDLCPKSSQILRLDFSSS
jgi:hypothetical protein